MRSNPYLCTMDNLYSIHLADNINLRQLKTPLSELSSIKLNLIGESTTELFYKTGDNKYLSVYNYGAAAFINFNEEERNDLIIAIESKSQNIEKEDVIENIQIEFGSKLDFKSNLLTIDAEAKDSTYRIIMFDISQSVALDYYSKISDVLMDEINGFAKQLEKEGDLNLSRKEIMKFIGRSLITKNNIVDTLYIFDSPDIAWEDESVDKLHGFLTGVFDLKLRYHEVESTFKVIDENLATFRDLYQHKSSSNMEKIVIILIAIEILDIVLNRLHIFK